MSKYQLSVRDFIEVISADCRRLSYIQGLSMTGHSSLSECGGTSAKRTKKKRAVDGRNREHGCRAMAGVSRAQRETELAYRKQGSRRRRGRKDRREEMVEVWGTSKVETR